MSFWTDLAERALRTYLQALLGLLTASATAMVDLSSLRAAAVAAIPAGLSVVNSALARAVGDPRTASMADRLAVDELGNLETAP